jgi:hypothetical protein
MQRLHQLHMGGFGLSLYYTIPSMPRETGEPYARAASGSRGAVLSFQAMLMCLWIYLRIYAYMHV